MHFYVKASYIFTFSIFVKIIFPFSPYSISHLFFCELLGIFHYSMYTTTTTTTTTTINNNNNNNINLYSRDQYKM